MNRGGLLAKNVDGHKSPTGLQGLVKELIGCIKEGSPVEVTTTTDPKYGVVRWTGNLPDVPYRVAGVELEEDLDGCTDGMWQGTGHRFFHCRPGRAFFCPLHSLKLGTRLWQPKLHYLDMNPLEHIPLEEEEDQGFGQYIFSSVENYAQPERGIQGHQNSDYIDATLFGLFALSDVFDSLFLERSCNEIEESIKNTLWRGIVNPLRKNGAVRFESVMRFRNKLDELGKMKAMTTAEKDPEEFLNMLFKHTLYVEPFIQIKRPFGTESEFFVQLFVEFDESMKNPTVEKLLQKMFKEQQISFAHVPSKLLVQLPRYGKLFKMYQRTIPGLKLDLIPLLDCPHQCKICGQPARNTCAECRGTFPRVDNSRVYFCDTCNERVHSYKDQADCKTERCRKLAEAGELELLSVICIETSHFVCFARDSEGKWVFSDSMADRLYDKYNIPHGVDCTAELSEWVYGGSTERLMAASPRELPELVRRFTQDMYMCVYIQPDYSLYGLCNPEELTTL